MALIKCYECGKEISDKIKYCIKCGAPIKDKKKYKKYNQMSIKILIKIL